MYLKVYQSHYRQCQSFPSICSCTHAFFFFFLFSPFLNLPRVCVCVSQEDSLLKQIDPVQSRAVFLATEVVTSGNGAEVWSACLVHTIRSYSCFRDERVGALSGIVRCLNAKLESGKAKEIGRIQRIQGRSSAVAFDSGILCDIAYPQLNNCKCKGKVCKEKNQTERKQKLLVTSQKA